MSVNPSHQEQFDEATFEFSQGNYDGAIDRLRTILALDPGDFEARLALGMAYYRKGEYPAAIAEGLKAQDLRPNEQLVHTNLSLFYMKNGDKPAAEHHGLQARIASWKTGEAGGPPAAVANPELELAKPKPPAPEKFPDMPWKKKTKIGGGAPPVS